MWLFDSIEEEKGKTHNSRYYTFLDSVEETQIGKKLVLENFSLFVVWLEERT